MNWLRFEDRERRKNCRRNQREQVLHQTPTPESQRGLAGLGEEITHPLGTPLDLMQREPQMLHINFLRTWHEHPYRNYLRMTPELYKEIKDKNELDLRIGEPMQICIHWKDN